MMRLYENGLSLATTPASGLLLTNDEDLLIGTRTQEPANTFDGVIDDVSLWNRALSDGAVPSRPEEKAKLVSNSREATMGESFGSVSHPAVSSAARLTWTARRVAMAALILLGSCAIDLHPTRATAAPVTFSGTISYEGSHSGDSLYVAVVDTAGPKEVTLHALMSTPVGPPPFDEDYSLDFDNADASAEVFIAAFLDVDGGGIDDVGGADVFGWYAGGMAPTEVSTAASLSGLDFELPRAEIHGTLTFAPDQVDARVDVSTDPDCLSEGFRPGHLASGPGPYAIIGVYPGTYCVRAEGSSKSMQLHTCHGDPECESPTLITLTATEVRMGVDLDFSTLLPVEAGSWGRLKARYR